MPAPRIRVPALRIHWTPWYRVFLSNLADLLLLRKPPQARITALPSEFWPDVFVPGGLPWRTMFESALYHLCFIAALWTCSVIWPAVPRAQRLHSPFDNSTLTYYSVSEYLPEINTGTPEPPKERKGEPAYARQKIISLPPSPDNRRQTVITPSNIKLPQDAPLPNIVAWTPVPAPIPEAAMTRARLTAPAPAVNPVAPPPDPTQATSRLTAPPAPEVVQPASDPSAARTRLNLPNVPGPEVVAPPPSLDAAQSKIKTPALPEPAVVGPAVSGENARPIGAMSIARVDIGVAAPELPVSEQRPAVLLKPGQGRAHGSGGAAPNVAPPTSVVAGAGMGKQDAGQLIALSVNPAPVSGPIKVPAGSRHGEFAAGPEGKPGAPGTPDIRGGAGGGNGTGHGNTAGPPGISVSPGPTPVPPGVVVAAEPPKAPAPPKPKSTLLASLGPSRVADLARNTRPGASVAPPEKLDDRVFAGKKFYSMTLNMPNMTSAGGSWIIRFAELHETKAGDLTAPVATLKVDPAYPAEAMRDRVEGTVAVYAVIRRDGTVAEVRVLRGFDQRLDESARIAVSHWQFRPATKNGEAVDLEAVFHVPFVARRSAF